MEVRKGERGGGGGGRGGGERGGRGERGGKGERGRVSCEWVPYEFGLLSTYFLVESEGKRREGKRERGRGERKEKERRERGEGGGKRESSWRVGPFLSLVCYQLISWSRVEVSMSERGKDGRGERKSVREGRGGMRGKRED